MIIIFFFFETSGNLYYIMVSKQEVLSLNPSKKSGSFIERLFLLLEVEDANTKIFQSINERSYT